MHQCGRGAPSREPRHWPSLYGAVRSKVMCNSGTCQFGVSCPLTFTYRTEYFFYSRCSRLSTPEQSVHVTHVDCHASHHACVARRRDAFPESTLHLDYTYPTQSAKYFLALGLCHGNSPGFDVLSVIRRLECHHQSVLQGITCLGACTGVSDPRWRKAIRASGEMLF